MRTKITQSVMIGLAGMGLLLCVNTQAAINLLDGPTVATVASGAGSQINTGFTVSQGATVMVVELWDRNQQSTDTSPSFLTWSNTTTSTTHTLTKAVSEITAVGGYSDCIIYYLYNPTPGDGIVSGTDTNGTAEVQGLTMMVFTLSGVDATVTPVPYATNGASVLTLSVTTSSNTPAGAWAAVISYDANTGWPIINASTSGTSYYQDVANNQEQALGYVSGLAAGSSTISMTEGEGGGAAKATLAVAVFAPIPSVTAPTNVVVTSETNQIALSWNDASGGVATNYIVSRSTTSGSGYLPIATNAATTYTDTSVSDWTTYFYVVQAVGSSGVGQDSVEVSAHAVGLPALPTGVTATAGINQVTLAWSAQLGATSFNILRSTTSGSGFTPIGSSSTNGFTDTSVTDGTLYYYEIQATNSFGLGPISGQASAVPVVTFFTNYFGVFNSAADTAQWVTVTGTAVPLFDSVNIPPSGPSTNGCMVMDAVFGPGSTNSVQGIATSFPVALNVSTYQNLELDIYNVGNWDEYGQIQAIQLSLEGGIPGFIPLYQGAQGGTNWTHYSIPLTNWADYDLTYVTVFGINIFDGDTTNATQLDVGFANIAFTGAPGWASVFSGLASQSIASGATSVTLTGTVSGTVAGADVYCSEGTPVTVTINGNTQQTAINDGTGDFSINYDTTGFTNGIYAVTYTVPADMVALVGATNNATSLKVGVVSPPTPTIGVFRSGGNLVLTVANTAVGHSYYLLTTTNLNPPEVWTTNSVTMGTGGTITNLVPITRTPPDRFFKYLVQ